MQTAYPLPQTPATVSRWARMARLFASPCVVGTPVQNPYGATISGLTVTIGRGSTGVAEAWVRTFFHVLDAADWSVTVPPNTAAQSRVDRIVLRWDPEVEDVFLVHVQGEPAANPAAQPLTQTETGIWELPLWRFTAPPNSGAPLTGLVDDRYWRDPTAPDLPLAALVPATTNLLANSAPVGAPTTAGQVTVPDQGRPYYIVVSLTTSTDVDSGGSGVYLRLRVGPSGIPTTRATSPTYFGGVQDQSWIQLDQPFGPFAGPSVVLVDVSQAGGSSATGVSVTGSMSHRVVPVL